MIHVVILAGGWGRRFWPRARRKFPKQLLMFGLKLDPLRDLFKMVNSQIPKSRIWLVVNQEYAAVLKRHLPALSKKNFLVEPLSRNTAVAIGLASLAVKRVDSQAVIAVLPSDQIFSQKRSFMQAIKKAGKFAAGKDVMLTLGFRPNRPAEEYGYLKIIKKQAKSRLKNGQIYKVDKFLEKPNAQKAKIYLRSKNYLWNGGIFIAQVETLLKSIKKHLPRLYSGLARIEKHWGSRKQLLREYQCFKDISIEYGVMEKAGNVYTLAGDFSWQDLGNWASLDAGILHKDGQGNITQGLYKGIATHDSIIFGQNQHLITTLGIKDLIVVHTPSATLVCKKDQAQKVKQLTQILEKSQKLKKYL